MRNTVLSVREEPYVEAGRALGAKPRTVIRRYVFANVVQSVPVVASLNAADAILTLAGLSFLGIGMDPSVAAEWGYDISRGHLGRPGRLLVDRAVPGDRRSSSSSPASRSSARG